MNLHEKFIWSFQLKKHLFNENAYKCDLWIPFHLYAILTILRLHIFFRFDFIMFCFVVWLNKQQT